MLKFYEIVIFIILSTLFAKKLSELTELEFGVGLIISCGVTLLIIITYFALLISNLKHSSDYEDL